MAGLREQAQHVNELLRHFWRGLPVTSRARADKLRRVVAALEGMYKQSEVMMSAAAAQDAVYVSQMLRPSLRAMDAAFDKFADVEGAVTAALAG